VLRPAEGFHRDHAGREYIKEIQQSMQRHTFGETLPLSFDKALQDCHGLAQNIDVH
jgi:hypothetical protein